MAWSFQPLADVISPQKAKEAHHKGWLAGVTLRLGCGSLSRNPYDRESDEWIHWDNGFELGLAG